MVRHLVPELADIGSELVPILSDRGTGKSDIVLQLERRFWISSHIENKIGTCSFRRRPNGIATWIAKATHDSERLTSVPGRSSSSNGVQGRISSASPAGIALASRGPINSRLGETSWTSYQDQTINHRQTRGAGHSRRRSNCRIYLR